MSERFARGLGEYLERHGFAPLDDDPRWADLGRLAVALMREPTEAMIDAAPDYVVTDGAARDIWNAMIDAELVDD